MYLSMEISTLLQLMVTIISIVTSVGTLGYWLARRFTILEKRMEFIEKRIESLERSLLALAEITKSAQEFLLDFLTYEGILRRESVIFAKTEINRIYHKFELMKPYSEFTQEDLKEMGRLIKKDELTWEEAQRLKQLVWKAIKEYGHKFPALWKIYWYAEFMAALAIKKEVESKKKQ